VNRPDAAARRVDADLAAVAYYATHGSAFVQAVSELDSALIRRAQRDALESIKRLETILAPYKDTGKLPAELELVLHEFMAEHAERLVALSDDVGRALTALVAAYQPPRTISFWYKTRFLPWWRQDDAF